MTAGRAGQRLRDSLGGFTRPEIEDLVRDAHGQARERVLAALVDAITEATLDRVCAVLSEAKPTVAVAQPDITELGWYVYCVLRTGGAAPTPSLQGVQSQHATSLLERGELAAVVSRVALADFGEEPLRAHLGDMEWLERTARAHEEVLERLGSERTLIPMRMCTVYRSESGVLEMLEREAQALTAALQRLHEKSEWGVKVFAGQMAPITVEESPAAGQGTAYLQQRRREREELREIDSRVESACGEIHERLSAVAVDALVSAPQRPEVSGHPGQMVLNGAYLLEDDRREQFVAELEQLRSEFASLALEFVLTGPWPAYNFVPGTIGAAW